MKQIFPACIPLAKAGEKIAIDVAQTLDNRLKQDGPKQVHVVIDGPQINIPADMIAGVYPAPGSEQSPDEFLPHIAFTRRTLPWERQGPNVKPDTPWLALLLFKESELRSTNEMKQAPTVSVTTTKVQDLSDAPFRNRLLNNLKIPGSAEVSTLRIANSLLKKIMPTQAELTLLSHMKRSVENGVEVDNAIVISNRLPDANAPEDEKPQLHTAVLISVEAGLNLYPARASGFTTLLVLHHWTFRPSKGGDFEQVMKSIAYRPHGGVLRFGNLPVLVDQGEQAPLSGGFKGLLDADGYFRTPLEHDQETNATYRSPLHPFGPQPRSNGFAIAAAPNEFTNAPEGTPLDYSHAAAFELGRLLAFNDPAILEDLREVRGKMKPIEPPVEANPLPPALQKPDWVVNPADFLQQPWETGLGLSLVKDQNLFLDKGIGDVTGINDQIAQWDIGNIVSEIAGIGAAVSTPVIELNIATIDMNTLDEQFADVAQAAKGN